MDGAELLQKDIAKRRREEREALQKAIAAEEAGDLEGSGFFSEDESSEGGEESDEEEEEEKEEEEDNLPDLAALKKLKVVDLKEILTARGLSTTGKKDELIQRLDESRGAVAKEEESEEEGDEDDVEESGSEDEEGVEWGSEIELESGSEGEGEGEDDGRIRDPITGRKRQRITPALTVEQKKEIAAAAVAEAQAAGAPLPKVRKNGILSLAELRRRHKAAAKAKREQEDAENDGAEGDGDSDDGMIEQERILTPEDFKRIKALRTAKQLSGAMEKSGAKKANETANDELRAMLRRADRSGVADRRVDPDTLAAVGLKRAHDKESRVASIMAGRADRGEFGSAKSRKQNKTGGSNNKEKMKRKNLPLAARVRVATKRRTGGPSKAVKEKQFKGRFRR